MKTPEDPTTKTISSSTERERGSSRVPRYSVGEVAEMMRISIHTLRYYDKLGLFPFLRRDENNVRLFSDFDLRWVRIVHCLRSTGLPLMEVRRYVELCLAGDSTIDERAEIIYRQEETLRENIRAMEEQLKILQVKKSYYEALQENRELRDSWNPTEK
ncbi:MAG: MerR family transcriptional regulator [Planctomycetia bacterium]|nr:MerR family transcriptional regulator [Planctomycetia bacterium]